MASFRPTPPLRAHAQRLPALSTRQRLHGLAALAVAGGLLAVLTAAPAHARAVDSPETEDRAREAGTDRLVVKYRHASNGARRIQSGTSHPLLTRLQAAGWNARLSHRNAQGALVVRLDGEQPLSTVRALSQALMAQDPDIEYAEPDYRVSAWTVPNDPMYSQQWHYFDPVGGLNLPDAWSVSTGQGAIVAVVDTGVRPHADLADNLVDGYDFISDTGIARDGDGRDADAYDPGDGCSGSSSWHGTHVAGTVAAVSNNGLGVAGVAWNAKVMPVRALGCGGGYLSDVADGMLWAAGATVSGVSAPSQAARVINLSLGAQTTCPTSVQNAINTVRALGTVVVAAAGNSNLAAGQFSPAGCKGVITVAAIGRGGRKAPYSNFGGVVDVAAPGGNMSSGASGGVLSTYNAGGSTPGADSYNFLQGTSMAAPHVAGVAALMIARNPNLTADEVEVLLRSTVRAFPAPCSGCGTGIVNANAAVRATYLGSSAATDVSEGEPNDSHAQAQALSSLPARVTGTIARTTDVDTFKVSVPAGATVTARLIGNLNANYDLVFRSAREVVLSSSTRAAGLFDRLSWKNSTATAATLFIRVRYASGTTGENANGQYTLEVTR